MDASTSTSSISQDAVLERRKIREANAKRRGEGLEALKADGNEAFKSGDYKKAAALYGSAIEKYGRKAVLCSNLAAALYKLELWKDADWAATLALKANPKMTKARFRRAMARKASRRWEAAVQDLQTIVKSDPTFKEAATELAIVLPIADRAFEQDEDDEDDYNYIVPGHPGWPTPGPQNDPTEPDSDSDTEDCRHKGNGIACYFYNHSKCTRGQDCSFSHAPDDKSVRDELGRNVCIHYILGNCKFNDAVCIYCHDKTYLPASGWWTEQAKIGLAKLCNDSLEATQFDAEKCESTLYCIPTGLHVGAQSIKALESSRLEKVLERVQAAKNPLSAPAKPKSAPPAPASVAPDEARFILLISLEHEDYFSYASLIKEINAKRPVVHVFLLNEALEKMASPLLDGVIVTDAGISKSRCRVLTDKLVGYAKSGGTVVMGCNFSNFIAGDDFEKVFRAFGLQWQRGSYFRTTHSLNPTNHVAASNPSLAPSYSMKALHADKISPDMAVYKPTSDSVLQSHVFAPQRIKNLGEAPIVIGKVGLGEVGYVGDVNAERYTTKVYLAMLGILDSPKLPPGSSTSKTPKTATTSNPFASIGVKTPVTVPTNPKPSTSGLTSTAAKTPTKTTISTINLPKAKAKSSAAPSAAATKPLTAPTKNAPVILTFLENKTQPRFMKAFGHQLGVLKGKTKVEIATSRDELEQRLASRSIRGIYIADAGILKPENKSLLPKLASYVKAGGTVVAGGLFPSMINIPDSKAFFSAFGQSWSMASHNRAVYELTPSSELARKNPSLPDMFSIKSSNLKDINLEVPVYLAYPDSEDEEEDEDDNGWGDDEPFDAPIVRARVGRGTLGYIGDVEGSEEISPVVLAMFGLLHPEPTAAPPKRKSKPFVMVLSWSPEDLLQSAYGGFLEPLKGEVETLYRGLSIERMADLIPSPDLLAVLVDGSEIASPDEAYVLSKLMEFTQNGGTVIFLDGFAQGVTVPECRPFFLDAWGLDWTVAASHYPLEPSEVKTNEKNALVVAAKDRFPKAADLSGSHTMASSNPDDIVFMPKSGSGSHLWDEKEGKYAGPALFTEVSEKGKVGFVGYTTPAADYFGIVSAMIGL